ncbi:MAG: hypothetical protein LBN27_09700 [Prevotellaceae bacterium]|jgi:hypothetical protein|nr:hypothetical protein [Prevotellaceae bacterium]
MIKIQARPEFINQLRIFDWGKNLQVDWHNFLDYCRFSNLATIIVEDMTIYSLKTSSGKIENFEWFITKPSNELFADELVYIMNLKKYDLENLTKIKKDKLTGTIYGTYCRKLN